MVRLFLRLRRVLPIGVIISLCCILYCGFWIHDLKHLSIFDHMESDETISTELGNGNEIRIPKTIHQIWIGNRKIPKWADSWRIDYIKSFPEYTYKLWTLEDAKNSEIENVLGFEKSMQGKSDIMRYWILYNHGGTYIDIDSEWINHKSLTPLLNIGYKSECFA
eukprot:841241_1